MREYSEEELKLLNEVLPNVAQELRGSMARIYHAVNRLAPTQAREADPEVDQKAADFTQGYYRIYRIVNNLTEAQHLSEDMRYELRNADIVGLCRDICEQAAGLFAMQGVALAFESDKMGCVIGVNTEKIEHLLFNLLSNALKYTPDGGKVTVSVKCGARFVSISVVDTGCGIAPEKLETVFDRFLYTDPYDPAPHGIGLGLAICRHIARGHGGRIFAESTEGVGSTFTVALPNVKLKDLQLRTPRMDYAGGFNKTLLELADALPSAAFTHQYLD